MQSGFPTFCEDLGGFLLRDAFYRLEDLLRRVRYALHCIVARVREQLDIALRQTCGTLHSRQHSHREQLRAVMHTSRADSGVGAPGPPARPSS